MDQIKMRLTQELLQLYGDVLSELRSRNVVRTSNLTGDYAEFLFSEAFGWKLNANSASGYDATDDNNVKYQIKCRKNTPTNKSRELSAFRNLNKKSFDKLAAVILDENFRVIKAALVPYNIILEKAKHSPHVNGGRFILRDSIWDMATVEDVTEKLKSKELLI